jgi:lipopolysaccharide transport system permease protein/teichoic acid transport system permease protein
MAYFTMLMGFFKDLYKSRWLIGELTKKDFQVRYLGSYLGILWAFIHPSITICLFWFVFEVGFKSVPVDNFPFILWLVTGMFPWFFFTESFIGASNSIVENSFLVKKVVFRVSILPIIKISSALIIHVFFVIILFLMFYSYGYSPTIYSLQVIYYLFAMICLVLGASWVTSSLVIFLRDVAQVIAMVIQFGFWITPIFWPAKMIPDKYSLILYLNPVYYIVEGYRNSFIYYRWFWEDPWLTAYFWGFTLVILALGAFTFRRLRPHFADVL